MIRAAWLLRAFFTAGAVLSTSAALPCLNLRTDLLGSLHWLGSGRDMKWHVQLYILNKRRGQVWISGHLRCLYLIMPQCSTCLAGKDGHWESKDEGFGLKATHYWSLSTYHSGNAVQRPGLPYQVVDNCNSASPQFAFLEWKHCLRETAGEQWRILRNIFSLNQIGWMLQSSNMISLELQFMEHGTALINKDAQGKGGKRGRINREIRIDTHTLLILSIK